MTECNIVLIEDLRGASQFMIIEYLNRMDTNRVRGSSRRAGGSGRRASAAVLSEINRGRNAGFRRRW